MSGESVVRVLVCDDHPVVRSGLLGMLSGEPDLEVVGEAVNGVEAVALARRLRPDVVLMDLQMPEMDGAAAMSLIKEEYPRIRVLVLTSYETDADILKAIETGADGYVLKNAPSEDLFGAIRAVAKGGSPLTPAVAAKLVRRVRGGRGPGTEPEDLGVREIEVLELVASGASNKEIARRLWVSESTVKTYVLHVFDKLGVDDRTAAVTEALKRGILRL